MVHSANASKTRLWSFEDEILHDMSAEEIRQIPPGGEHSIAWNLLIAASVVVSIPTVVIFGLVQRYI